MGVFSTGLGPSAKPKRRKSKNESVKISKKQLIQLFYWPYLPNITWPNTT